MASLSSIIFVLLSAFGLINGIPTKVTTKSTKVTHHAANIPHLGTFPYVYNAPPPAYNPHAGLASVTHTQTHYPYIYGTTGLAHHGTHHVSPPITTHHATPYPYVYGWGQSIPHMPNYNLAAPYPYMYGWSSPFSHAMPNYGLQFGYPPALYKTGYSGYY